MELLEFGRLLRELIIDGTILNMRYVPGSVLWAGGTAVNETDSKSPSSAGDTVSR